MEFRIADTFTDSLARLTSQEQKAVKTTAFDLQMNPAAPGLSFHRIERSKDENFWSVRVNGDIRLIVHKTASSFLLAYVDHHDDAYRWAEKRRMDRHPMTGAMQLVQIRERIEDADIYAHAVATSMPPKPSLFDNLRKFEVMALGVPEDWVEDVRKATEDSLFDLLSHLPQEAQEALLKLAVGEPAEAPKPAPAPAAAPATEDGFAHPDAQRRFHLVASSEDLQRALDFPWEKWAIFLHPDQEALVSRDFSGPVRVSGSAGTGKTIVALHRAVHLARSHPGKRVLLTTFSKGLAHALNARLKLLVGSDSELTSRIEVKAFAAVGYDLYAANFGQPNLASSAQVRTWLTKAAGEVEGHKFSPTFLVNEWSDVVDAWQLGDWEAYRDVTRLGRKTRIGGRQREILWAIFEKVRASLDDRKLVTWSDVFGRLTGHFNGTAKKPYDFAVVDEAQDLGVAEARFLAQAVGVADNALFLAGDMGQRIFQQPFSWKALGLDVRGRSFTLRINYRTSQQIREMADRLLPNAVTDVDGNREGRKGTVSLFEGPAPEVRAFDTEVAETQDVATWVSQRLAQGIAAHEIVVFVRSDAEMVRARKVARAAGLDATELDDRSAVEPGRLNLSTMHFAKGLEFRAVAVMACDDEVIPNQTRIEAVSDQADLEEVYTTERHLLYVACTRARDHLLVCGVEPASEFLGDL
ncbi:3'-5' exonuclease [Asticcacaulis sp. AC402]|uniref:3'-5' exonuclease n=1 Tax=Asticcacaulis sp. AC402 TaxID=1282361 RepID=UPI0003C3C5BA|nr:3'-5' exonuclease [Asticcacaulis sp. AC402]ESQ74513.1 DNA helicase [Asticcacaulis sp. AC402]